MHISQYYISIMIIFYKKGFLNAQFSDITVLREVFVLQISMNNAMKRLCE